MRKGPTGRALRLLSPFGAMPGAEPVERLEVAERTVRGDLDRQRDLGYPVDTASGKHGRTSLGASRPIKSCGARPARGRPPTRPDRGVPHRIGTGARFAASWEEE